MTNKLATLKFSLSYPDGNNVMQRVPDNGSLSCQAPFQAESVGVIDVPDTTASATEYSIPFGSIGVGATFLLVQNKTGQDLEFQMQQPPSASGALVSGTKDLTLDNAVGDRLSVLLTVSGGTPGVLSVKRKSATEVTVQSWLAATGIQASDTSTVTVYNYGPAHYLQRVPDKGLAVFAMPAAAGAKKITSAIAKTTGTQSGAGTIAYYVFGDPT